MAASSKRTGVRKYFYDSLSGQRHWESREAAELLNVFENHHFLFGVMASDEDVWILMASALQDKGVEVTAKQVDKKWARMRETFKRIGDAKFSSAASKELEKPLRISYLNALKVGSESDVIERYLSKTRRPPSQQPRKSILTSRNYSGRHFDDYETLKTMYKLSLLR